MTIFKIEVFFSFRGQFVEVVVRHSWHLVENCAHGWDWGKIVNVWTWLNFSRFSNSCFLNQFSDVYLLAILLYFFTITTRCVRAHGQNGVIEFFFCIGATILFLLLLFLIFRFECAKCWFLVKTLLMPIFLCFVSSEAWCLSVFEVHHVK